MSKISSGKIDKIKEAEKDYLKIWEEIKPFIKKRERKEHSNAELWRVSGCELTRE